VGFTGAPQLGQFAASELISFSHSLPLISAIFYLPPFKKKRDNSNRAISFIESFKYCRSKQNDEPQLVAIPIRSASATYFLKMGNHSIYVEGGVFYAFLKPTFRLTLLWFSVVTVLCDFLCNVMRKVQQKQWQIFCRKVFGN
jgi:hypothetical protein